MPTDPVDNTLPLPEGIEAQTRQVMANLETVLDGSGYDLTEVVQARIYLTNFERDYETMNETYKSYFPLTRLPARTTIGVTGLARGALVEIDLVAWKAE
jgi:enamine deaminase RidA (YjgF/YER057c/UK114 family)